MKSDLYAFLLSLLLLIDLLASQTLANAQNFASATNLVTTQIEVTPYQQLITRGGKVAFVRTYELAFTRSGYLAQLSVDEGDFFAKDQLLASLDSFELQANKRSRYAELMQAERNVARQANLVEKNLTSDLALDNANTQLATARSAYQVASYHLDKAELKSTFAGVVLARYSDPGELQVPNQVVLKVADSQQNAIVKLGLTEDEIALVSTGQIVDVELSTAVKKVGKISKIAVSPESQNGLYVIEIELSDTRIGQGVVVGQLATVTLRLNSDDLVYQVPINALVKMLANGRAVLLTRQTEQQQPIETVFDVRAVDSHSLYLFAGSSSRAVKFVLSAGQGNVVSE